MTSTTKGFSHIDDSQFDEIISLAIFGGIVGGIRHQYGVYEKFDPIGVLEGLVTFAGAGFMAAAPEAIIGFCLYNIEGAIIATIASSSYEAAFLTILTLPSLNYPLVLTASISGAVAYLVREEIFHSHTITDQYKKLTSFNAELSELAGNVTYHQQEIV